MRHLEPNERPKFEQALRNDTLILSRLLAIIEDEYAGIERTEETDSQFDNPNWQYQAVFRMGERARLKKVMTLLNFLKE